MPGFCALVVREETPSPLPVGCPADGLSKLTGQYRVMVTLGHNIALLLAAGGGPDLPGGPFRLGAPHQAHVKNPLTEVHTPRNPGPDLLGPAYAQRLCENDVGEDEGYLGVPTPTENPPLFRGQDFHETAPHCYIGRGIPAH